MEFEPDNLQGFLTREFAILVGIIFVKNHLLELKVTEIDIGITIRAGLPYLDLLFLISAYKGEDTHTLCLTLV